MIYICIELFEERAQKYLADRLNDPKFADNAGDGILECAIPWKGSILDAYEFIYNHCDAFDLPDHVEIDSGDVRWYVRRASVIDAMSSPWTRVAFAHAIGNNTKLLAKLAR